jgi:phosphatidylethanolamine-binding protein (PEBP) family uncharacterized protein
VFDDINMVQVTTGRNATSCPPSIRWSGASAFALYTLLMVDGDAPPPYVRSPGNVVRHWAIANVPGRSLVDGETGVEGGTILSSYSGPHPPRGSGVHRYNLLLFLQPGGARLDDAFSDLASRDSRYNWNVTAWTAAHALLAQASTSFEAVHAKESRLDLANQIIADGADAPLPPRGRLLSIVACVAVIVASVGVFALRLSQPSGVRWREHRDLWPSARSTTDLLGRLSEVALDKSNSESSRGGAAPNNRGLSPLREHLVDAAPVAPRGGAPLKRAVSLMGMGV